MEYGRIINGKVYLNKGSFFEERLGSCCMCAGNDDTTKQIHKIYPIRYTSCNLEEGVEKRYRWELVHDEIVQIWYSVPQDKDIVLELFYLGEGAKTQINMLLQIKEMTEDSLKEKIAETEATDDFTQFCFNRAKELKKGKTEGEIAEYLLKNAGKKNFGNELHLEEFFSAKGYSSEGNYGINPQTGESISLFSYWKTFNKVKLLYEELSGKSNSYNMVQSQLHVIIDDFLLSSIKLILPLKPGALYRDEKVDLRDCSFTDSIEDVFIRRTLDGLSWKDAHQKLDFITGKLKIKIEENIVTDFVLFSAKRNVNIHNKGIVNEGMINKLKKTKYANTYVLGQDISPTSITIEEDIKFALCFINTISLNMQKSVEKIYCKESK